MHRPAATRRAPSTEWWWSSRCRQRLLLAGLRQLRRQNGSVVIRPCLIGFFMVWLIWRRTPTFLQEQPPTSFVDINSNLDSLLLFNYNRSRHYYFEIPLKQQQRTSDEAWQQLLQQFQSSMKDRSVGLWLPFVIQGRDLFVRQDHVYQFASLNRMDAFVQMMFYARRFILQQLLPQTVLSLWEQQRDIPIPLLLGIGDHHECGSRFPRLTWCTTPEQDTSCHNLAIPSFNIFLSRPDTSRQAIRILQQQDERYPWSQKKRLAVWRGAPTGRTPPNGDWTSLPRVQVVNYSLAYPHLLDAAFVTTKQFQTLFPDQVPRLRQQSRFAKRIPLQDFQSYRAVIDIDGNSWSSRFGELLCMNSVVVKVQPNNKNYFYDELQPWQHYIPVRADLSNLLEMIQIAIANETLARSIVRQANEWCQQRLTRQSMALDVFWKLQLYLETLGIHNNATRRRQWQAVWDTCQREAAVVSLQPWFGFSQWNVPWRMTKPIHQLLQMFGL